MKLDFTKLGAGLMASSPLLMNMGSSKEVWWIGVGMAIVGPVLMSMTHNTKKK